MITGITIENFKGIREPVHLDLRPITLLFGANSAGKSSIMHAFHYFREVFLHHNLDADLTEFGGNAIHLGGFRNLQTDHEQNRSITIRVDCSADVYFEDGSEYPHEELLYTAYNTLGINADLIIEELRPDCVGIELTTAWNAKTKCPFVQRTRLYFENEWFAVIEAHEDSRDTLITSVNFQHPLLAFPHEVPAFFAPGDEPLSTLAVYWRLLSPCFEPYDSEHLRLRNWNDAGGFWSRTISLDINPKLNVMTAGGELLEGGVARKMANAFKDVLSFYIGRSFEAMKDELLALKYIGPIREVPPRDWPRSAGQTSWSMGLAAWDVLHRGSNRLVELVSNWFSHQDKLNAGFTVDRIDYIEVRVDSSTGDYTDGIPSGSESPVLRSRVILKPVGSLVELSLRDVGTGISQLLPIVVGAVDDGGDDYFSAFLIEQPELHVHPRMQAAMADLLIEKKNRTFIVETHSEHLILRLLRRIRETEKGTAPPDRQLRTDELAIYYLKKENGSSTASRIDVDVKGEFIQPWPDDFFEIDFYERFA